MPKVMRMPDLPPGPHRELVELLWIFYRAARRPSLEVMARKAMVMVAIPGPRIVRVSRETIRRVLMAEVVPAKWETLEAILLVLCAMSGRDPDADPYDDEPDGGTGARQYLEQFWNKALDEPLRPASAGNDPWAVGPPSGGGFTDDPPF